MVHVSDDDRVDFFQGDWVSSKASGDGFMDQFDAVHIQAGAL